MSLVETEAHVWEASPDAFGGPQAERACLEVLSAEERARHDRFVFEKDRHVFRVAHAMLRHVLGGYLERPPGEVAFVVGPWGRPEIESGGAAVPLRFSLTHAIGHVACVVTRNADCGIDVEERAPADRIVEQALAPSEAAALRSLPPAEWGERFLALWTLKESLLKARGTGLSTPLDGFAFELDTARGDVVRFSPGVDSGPGTWRFWRWRASDRHRGAVAVRCAKDEGVQLARSWWEGP